MNTRKKLEKVFKSTFSVFLVAVMLLTTVAITPQMETAKASQVATVSKSQANEVKTFITVSTQKQLTKALSDKNIKTITIKTLKTIQLTIRAKDYTAKTLLVNSPKATITNGGTFQKLIVTDANFITENAIGNTYTVNDKKVTIKVMDDAIVKAITINRKNADCNMQVNGVIKNIYISKKVAILLNGKVSKNIPILVSATGKGAHISSSVPVDVKSFVDADIILEKGAESSSVTSVKDNSLLTVVNNTGKDVKLYTPDGMKTVFEGKTVTSRKSEDTGNEATPTPTSPLVVEQGQALNTISHIITFDSNGGTPINAIQVNEGGTLTKLPVPYKNNCIFLGWFTETNYLNKFSDNTQVYSDLTLYARYTEIVAEVKNLNDTFTLTEQAPGLSFTICSTDASMTADSVKNAIKLKVVDGSEAMELMVSGSNGTYTLNAQGGFKKGASYTLILESSSLNFKDEESTIRKCSFTIAKEEAFNLKLNDTLIYIHDIDVTQTTMNGAKIDSLSIPVYSMSADGSEDTTAYGTFTYTGSLVLKRGDVLCIYSGNKPTGGKDDAEYLDDDIAYVKVTAVTGSIGNQAVTYTDADAKEVLYMPDVLPIAVGEGNKLTNYTEATGNTPGSFTAAILDLNFSAYQNMGLSEGTTVDVGDYLAFYSGNMNDTNSVSTADYAVVTDVSINNGTETVTFTATTLEKMQKDMDYYSKNDISGETMLEGVDIAAFEENISQQVKESGFDKKAANYLASLALETDEVQKTAEEDMNLQSLSIGMAGNTDEDMNKIRLMSVTPNANIDIKSLKTKADIGSSLHKLPGSGLRCAVTISFDVHIKSDKKKEAIVISIAATFVEELKLGINAYHDMTWDHWAFIYWPTNDVYGVNIDFYNYTSINIQAIITSQNIDISQKIQTLMSTVNYYNPIDLPINYYSSSNNIPSGVQDLYQSYSDLIQNKCEDWVDIYKKQILGARYNVIDGILAVGVTADFVVGANVKVAVGCNFEYQSGTRYGIWVNVLPWKWGSGTYNIKLMPDKFNFQCYVMGTLGIRAGIRLELYADVLNHYQSIYAEAGLYAKLYGFFFYEFNSENNIKKSNSAGVLYTELGNYLAVSLTPLYNKNIENPLYTSGNRYCVYNFTEPPRDTFKMKDYKSYTLPDSVYNMTCIDLKEGNIFTSTYKPEDYTIAFTNNNFTLDGNTVNVNVPSGARIIEGDMVITWKASPLAFTSTPISRTYHLRWDDLNDDGYTISFDSKGGSAVNSITKQYGTVISKPAVPTRAGYIFNGWYTGYMSTKGIQLDKLYTFSTMPGENIILYAKWTESTNTPYRVEHYIQNIESSLSNPTFTLKETEVLSGKTNSWVGVSNKAYSGFTIQNSSTGGNIKGDGTLILKVYYTRNSYALIFKPQNGSNDIKNIYYYDEKIEAPTLNKTGYTFIGWDKPVSTTMPAEDTIYTAVWAVNHYTIEFNSNGGSEVVKIDQTYGTELKALAIPTRKGYVFDGWFSDSDFTKPFNYSTMPPVNITLYAKWNLKSGLPYTVEHYQQTVSGDHYDLVVNDTEHLTGTFNTTVQAIPKAYEGFACNSSISGTVSSGAVTEDGSLKLRMYYNRNEYTISCVSGSSMNLITQKYGTKVSEPLKPVKEGYTFGWCSDSALNNAYTFSTMPAQNITLYPKWLPNTNTHYKVEYYMQQENGSYILDASLSEDKYGTTGETVTAENKNYSGFHLNSNKSATSISGSIIGDGSLTLKLYYDYEKYSLWVGGVEVNEHNRGDILKDGKAAFDPGTRTLTLKDANITGCYQNNYGTYGIYDASTNQSLTINVLGNNTIDLSGNSLTSRQFAIGKAGNDLIIKGNDYIIGNDWSTICFQSGPATLVTAGICMKGNLTVTGNVNVTAYSGNPINTEVNGLVCAGIYAQNYNPTISVTNYAQLSAKGYINSVNSKIISKGYYNAITDCGTINISNHGCISLWGINGATDGLLTGANFITAKVDANKTEPSDSDLQIISEEPVEFKLPYKKTNYRYVCAAQRGGN